ncbi:MAG: protein kinase domain-containing protein [Blastocatellia bacterium]
MLAQLDHPNIARLLDGGTTADGRPYFVMEYVEGRTISNHCEANRLSINEKLKLFRQVCAAAQIAHRNMVAHRDLKPSNILVTEDGTVKLLDFGIAKLLAPDPALGAVTQTETALRAMTPEYASPEQARGLPITAATDIYSLGVVLYELLANRRPHQFKTYSPAEIERAICDTDPARPSEAVNVGTDAPTRLARRLAGDLDNIVMMAMRKEPDRRYQSVEQFSEDIRRHLEGLPVIARADTFRYRAGKFIRRHRLAVAALAVVLLSLLGGIFATTRAARVARAERERAERRFTQVRKLSNTFLFDFHDKIRNLPGSTEAREMVVRTALEYLDSLAQEAAGDPEIEWELAIAYQKVGDVQGDPWTPNLGRPQEAMKSYQKSLLLAQQLAERSGDELKILRFRATAYLKLGALQSEAGDKASANETLRQAVVAAESLAQRTNESEDLSLVRDFHARIGDTRLDTGDPVSALESYREARRLSERRATANPSDEAQVWLASDHAHVGEALLSIGDLPGALAGYQKSLSLLEPPIRRRPDNQFNLRLLRIVYNWLGNLSGNSQFINQGDEASALQYYRKALSISEAQAAVDPKNSLARLDLASDYANVADSLARLNPARGAEHYRKSLSIIRVLLESSPDEFALRRREANYLKGLAGPLRRMGAGHAALQNLRQALQLLRALSARNPANTQAQADLHATLLALADLSLETGDSGGALERYREASAMAESSLTAHPTDAYARWRLADSYTGLGQYHTTLGSDIRSPAAERLAHWRDACLWRRKALELWDSWNQYGVSSIFNAAKREQAARSLARCEAGLAKLRTKPL